MVLTYQVALEHDMFGDQFDTRKWLERQLRELEAWRQDLTGDGQGEARQIEQIDLHRQWLETQLARLATLG